MKAMLCSHTKRSKQFGKQPLSPFNKPSTGNTEHTQTLEESNLIREQNQFVIWFVAMENQRARSLHVALHISLMVQLHYHVCLRHEMPKRWGALWHDYSFRPVTLTVSVAGVDCTLIKQIQISTHSYFRLQPIKLFWCLFSPLSKQQWLLEV